MTNLLNKKKPSLNDWSFRIPGIIIFIIMIILESNFRLFGNCQDSSIKILDWFEAPGFLSLAYIGLGMFLMPYLIIIISNLVDIYKNLKGKNNNGDNLPNN